MRRAKYRSSRHNFPCYCSLLKTTRKQGLSETSLAGVEPDCRSILYATTPNLPIATPCSLSETWDKLIGEFLTTYDQANDRFKGVGVGAWGYVVWENSGFHEGRLSEGGYAFDNGRMTPVSRSEFERVSDSHYLVHDFDAGTASRSGAATDTEDCIKAK